MGFFSFPGGGGPENPQTTRRDEREARAAAAGASIRPHLGTGCSAYSGGFPESESGAVSATGETQRRRGALRVLWALDKPELILICLAESVLRGVVGRDGSYAAELINLQITNHQIVIMYHCFKKHHPTQSQDISSVKCPTDRCDKHREKQKKHCSPVFSSSLEGRTDRMDVALEAHSITPPLLVMRRVDSDRLSVQGRFHHRLHRRREPNLEHSDERQNVHCEEDLFIELLANPEAPMLGTGKRIAPGHIGEDDKSPRESRKISQWSQHLPFLLYLPVGPSDCCATGPPHLILPPMCPLTNNPPYLCLAPIAPRSAAPPSSSSSSPPRQDLQDIIPAPHKIATHPIKDTPVYEPALKEPIRNVCSLRKSLAVCAPNRVDLSANSALPPSFNSAWEPMHITFHQLVNTMQVQSGVIAVNQLIWRGTMGSQSFRRDGPHPRVSDPAVLSNHRTPAASHRWADPTLGPKTHWVLHYGSAADTLIWLDSIKASTSATVLCHPPHSATVIHPSDHRDRELGRLVAGKILFWLAFP
ncbi:hypothetical protein EYF80_000279 [Liparis tanakae]|uniref:Uncharacterized protein n=1 Tax=Liparis tanakae TaxID=230148 RepID=A0A4Z2JH96_9TELE|nr:hypothetical protein EYF80_000279 [Liparis tanakae]